MVSIDALVTDANQRVALEVIRCLGKRDVNVCAVETSEISSPLSFSSNYVTRTEIIEDYGDPAFRSLVQKSTAVFPISTNTLYAVYEQLNDHADTVLLPAEQSFRRANSKNRIRKRAQALDVSVPETRTVGFDESPSESEQPYPVVLKLENDEGLYLAPAERYRIVQSDREFRSAFQELSRHQKPIMVQQYISGEGYGYSLLMNRRSRVLAGGGHHRLREYPPSGGPSAYCESVEYEQLRDQAVRLLRDLDWVGPAMVEFRRAPGEDQFYFLEINPRYWGSLPLFRFAGINLPYLQYRAVQGGSDPDPRKELPAGTKLKFSAMDLMAFLRGSARWYDPVELARFLGEQFEDSVHRGIWDGDDPMPFFRYLFSRIASGGSG